MARRERIFVSGGIYHIYCRVARGERVFEDSVEAENWIQVVSRVAGIHELTILAWCLMSNHYHLVVRTGNMPLWRAMAVIQGRVAKGFNRRHRVLGRLWQSRYKARVVQDQCYLDQLLAYVHLNPVVAGIVDDPSDYPNSGHAELLGLVRPTLCDVSATLLSFDHDTTIARIAYERRVRVVAEARWLTTDVRNLPWWRTVDDDNETLPREEAPQGAADYLGQPLPPEEHSRPSLAAVLESFEDEVGLGHGQLTGGSRTQLLSQHRRMFATFAVSWLGYRSKEVGAVLGKASGSVSRWVSQGLAMQRSNPVFRCDLHMLAHRFARKWPHADLLQTTKSPDNILL